MKQAITALTFATLLFMYGCNDEYFADGGLLDDQVGMLDVTTMDYLESNPQQFDTLVTLIKMCGLEETVNAHGSTFLVPQDYSIRNYFELVFPSPADRPEQLSEIPMENLTEISAIIKNYIIPDERITRSNLSPSYSYATTLGSRKARFNLVRQDYLGNVNMGASYIVFSLNTNEGEGRERYQSVSVIISDLHSTNGIIHVLAPDSHILGFN